MIEIAPETAKRCVEKREGRSAPSAERFDKASCSRFGVDPIHPLVYVVAKE